MAGVNIIFRGSRMKITTIKGLRVYISRYSSFSEQTVNNVIKALGYPLTGTGDTFNELSGVFNDCSEHGAKGGFSGFVCSRDTTAFFIKNRQDIANHMEQTAEELGTDIFSMVQSFGVFRNTDKPSAGEIGKALWGNQLSPKFSDLYNVFAWYALEEISNTWYRYLEEHPDYKAELSA
jgi:hypothetical protein